MSTVPRLIAGRLSTAWMRTARLAAVLIAFCCSPTTELHAQQAAEEPAPIAAGVAPPPGPYAPGFDALHYDLDLVLPDTGSFIQGTMSGTFRIVAPRHDTLALDLTGLSVARVRAGGAEAPFVYDAGKLQLVVPSSLETGDTLDIQVDYYGRPDDGLILGRNIHGSPTAFADNWPNRARFWFPSIDHPSDKATVRFDVRMSPESDRRVISNGSLEPSGDEFRTGWITTQPIPTYTMVIGAAEFDVETVGTICLDGVCTEVTTWLFPPDAEAGASSFRRAAEMVEYYSTLIAPFPYAKLAHVQSSTRFGGMENVSAIFYPEQPISEGRDIELTVAHETAHQWFGDAVTESDWDHLWLSEGFASYFAALFFEHADGPAALRSIMDGYRQSYVNSGASSQPIVVETQDNLFDLLNANNYSKAAWVLHMLRNDLGNETFFDGIGAYYRAHEHGTVLTDDFRSALESASGASLEAFFTQWLYQPGHPRLEIAWSWQNGEASLILRQTQPDDWPVFDFPLEILFDTPSGPIREVVEVDARHVEVHIEVPERPTDLSIDPEGRVLMEVVSAESGMSEE